MPLEITFPLQIIAIRPHEQDARLHKRGATGGQGTFRKESRPHWAHMK